MPELLLASGNKKKLAELHRIVQTAGLHIVTIVGLEDVSHYPLPAETGVTFEENALIKARAGARATGCATLADDSGLAVNALSGMPGPLSARWAGSRSSDEANRDLLLEQMADFSADKREAYFVSVCALVIPAARNTKPQEFLTRGEWPGTIAPYSRGKNGFGYDPIFLPHDADGRSAAELNAQEKDSVSHRAKALSAMIPIFYSLWQPDSQISHQ